MTFVATRMQDDVALGFEGGPEDSVAIAIAGGGAETRNAMRSQFMREWTASFNGKTKAQSLALLDLWHAVGGRLYGFLFKDWLDFEASGSAGTVTLISGDTYQMRKAYVFGALTHSRIIYKPLSGTVAVSGGGSYTVSYTTGVITRNSGAVPTGWTGQFDVPVRFNMAKPNITALTKDFFSWQGCAIREIGLES